MGASRSFEEALHKSLRMTDEYEGVSLFVFKRSDAAELVGIIVVSSKNFILLFLIWMVFQKGLICPNYNRIYAIAKALYDDKIFNDSKLVPATIDFIYELMKIDKWFLSRIKSIVDVYKHMHYVVFDNFLKKG